MAAGMNLVIKNLIWWGGSGVSPAAAGAFSSSKPKKRRSFIFIFLPHFVVVANLHFVNDIKQTGHFIWRGLRRGTREEAEVKWALN